MFFRVYFIMINCKLCLSDRLILVDSAVADFEYRSLGLHDYWCCEDCGLLNIFPVPDEAILTEAYPATYHAYHPQPTSLARYLKKGYWRKKAYSYSRFVNKESSILEVGCSYGDLLSEIRALGFKYLKGLDFNSEVVKRAKRRGLDVFQGDLEKCSFTEESFQMVIMNNFIEHVYDPLESMQRCNSLLSRGGIVIGETPNIDSWDYKLFRRHWGGYHTPRHLYLFTVNNLNILAEKSGFRVKSIRNLLQPAHWALSVQNLIQDSELKTDLNNGRCSSFTLLIILSLPINILQRWLSKTSLVEFVFEKI